MAFGGKMGIDATKKSPEELAMRHTVTSDTLSSSTLQELASAFPEITQVNGSLLEKGISLLFIAVRKDRKGHLRELSQKLSTHPAMKGIDTVIFLEHTIDISDIADAVWRFANNVDPKRDAFILSATDEGGSHLFLDGTRKTKEHDGFQRDWPNILASEERTITEVDAMWNRLGLGPFLPSPSNKYRKQLYGDKAVAE
jgi:4-hydroxy-3-polyprenylbenzoate decarboxylase